MNVAMTMDMGMARAIGIIMPMATIHGLIPALHTRPPYQNEMDVIYFCYQSFSLDSSYLALLGSLLASPASGFPSIDPRQSGPLDQFWIFVFCFFGTSEKLHLGFLPPTFAWDGLETMERSALRFCISQLRRRVKRSSWSIFTAMSIRFILM